MYGSLSLVSVCLLCRTIHDLAQVRRVCDAIESSILSIADSQYEVARAVCRCESTQAIHARAIELEYVAQDVGEGDTEGTLIAEGRIRKGDTDLLATHTQQQVRRMYTGRLCRCQHLCACVWCV